MTEPIQLIDVRAHQARIGDEIKANIAAVVEHGKWIMGPEVAEFEKAMESFIGVDGVQALACSNGTDALVLAMQALGLETGEAVICPRSPLWPLLNQSQPSEGRRFLPMSTTAVSTSHLVRFVRPSRWPKPRDWWLGVSVLLIFLAHRPITTQSTM